jgi:DNA-binding response OmpR family regulator
MIMVEKSFSPMMRILIFENNRYLSHILQADLISDGWVVEPAYDCQQGLALADRKTHDVIIIDDDLPDCNGLDLCSTLHQMKNDLPILMLLSSSGSAAQDELLQNGADDYLLKPFALEELRARLQALALRTNDEQKVMLTAGDLSLDPLTHVVRRGEEIIDLTAKEYALLEFLMRRPNHLVSRMVVQQHVWSYEYSGGSNVVDVYIRRLRRKVDDPYPIRLIETSHGRGYRLRAPMDQT